MKKFLIFICLLVVVSLLIGQTSSSGLHRIRRNTKIYGWLNIQGDLWPMLDGKYDIGKSNYKWDSMFVNNLSVAKITGDSLEVKKLKTDFMVPKDSNYTICSTIVPNKDTSILCGNSDLKWKEIWALKFMGTDTSKADTFELFDNGAATYLASDNGIVLQAEGGNLTWSGYNLNIAIDTTAKLGQATYRWKEIWGLRYYLSSPDRADSTKIEDDGDTLRFVSDNPIKITAPAIVMDGNGTTKIDSLQIDDGTVINIFTFNSATFDANKTADTIIISGATTNNLYWIQVRGTVIPTSPFTCVAKIDSLIVNCAVSDTSIARSSGYNYLRLQ